MWRKSPSTQRITEIPPVADESSSKDTMSSTAVVNRATTDLDNLLFALATTTEKISGTVRFGKDGGSKTTLHGRCRKETGGLWTHRPCLNAMEQTITTPSNTTVNDKPPARSSLKASKGGSNGTTGGSRGTTQEKASGCLCREDGDGGRCSTTEIKWRGPTHQARSGKSNQLLHRDQETLSVLWVPRKNHPTGLRLLDAAGLLSGHPAQKNQDARGHFPN